MSREEFEKWAEVRGLKLLDELAWDAGENLELVTALLLEARNKALSEAEKCAQEIFASEKNFQRKDVVADVYIAIRALKGPA